MNQDQTLVKSIISGIQNKKGTNIVVADLSSIEHSPCDFFVICSGNSPLQVEAICDAVGEEARVQCAEKPALVNGLENACWVVIDYGTVIVHIFLPEQREFYDLEHLWEDAKLTKIADQV